jgi:membrane protein YdbS with pleckstrin-like domain
MTKTVTVPIKCSTVKKVKDSLPIILFWIILVASIISFGLLITTQNTIPQLLGGLLVLASVSLLLLWIFCPYEFKCIQEEK